MAPPLSPRELEILRTIRAGARGYYDIADRLAPRVSPRTAEAHVLRIYDKLEREGIDCPGTPLQEVIVYAMLTAEL